MVRSVIIVDDSPAMRTALRRIFMNDSDFWVCGEAENGKDAIAKAQQLNPDLIVTDLSMPVMNGLEEARILKELMPNLPVIIYTAYCDPWVEKEARSAGAAALVSKSASVASLIAKARDLFNQIAA